MTMSQEEKAELERLRAENENLRGQLSAAGASRPGRAAVQHQFVLSEGERQELEMHGNIEVGGAYVDTAGVKKLLGKDQKGVEIAAPDETREVPAAAARAKVPGVDFVYPSVEPGKIDPKVAGEPGIHGPAAKA